MAKRSRNEETWLLVLELLRRIPRNRKVSASELYRQLKELGLDRDKRTIERYLKTLSETFEIERDDRSRPYGYRWKENARGISMPIMSEQESLLLSLAEEYLRNLLPAKLMKSMEGFFAQAKYNLGPHSNLKQSREWLSKVRIVSTTQPLLPPKIEPKVFEEVSNALYANKWLRVDYRNAAGKRMESDVMPLGLAQQGPRLYLVCRFRGYDNERSLALHRIISARTLTLGFKPPKDFDLKKYDNDGRFGFGEGKRIRLRFRISREAGAHLLETPLSRDQQVTEKKHEYEITATLVDTAQLDWWLRSFGDQISHVRKTPLKGK